MKRNHWMRKTMPLGMSLLASLLAGCAVYVPPPPPVYVEPAPVYVQPEPAPEVVVEIHENSDFYEPLNPLGQWLDVPGYGRCWAPAGVDRDWRPYTDGHWERTDAGWYWVSDERWGWATYHYGRWFQTPDNGWVWAPQTQWAPAWVAWREGGGYAGWAPLPPEARVEANGGFEHREENIEPRNFVYVDERRMLEHHQHQTVIVNNTTIINQTVNITQIQVVNKTVINEGPHPEVISQASGRQVPVVAAHALRTRQEAPVAIAHKNPPVVNPPPVTQNRVPPMERHDVKPVQQPEPVARTVETSPVKPRYQEEPNGVTSNEKTVPVVVKKPQADEAHRPAPQPVAAPKPVVQPVKHNEEPNKPPKPAIQTINKEEKPPTGQNPVVKKPASPEQKPEQKPERKPAQKPEQKSVQGQNGKTDKQHRPEDEKSGTAPDAPPKSQP